MDVLRDELVGGRKPGANQKSRIGFNAQRREMGYTGKQFWTTSRRKSRGPTPIPFKPSFEIESQAEGHCGNILDASAKWMEEATTRPLEYAVLEDLDADKVNQLLDDQRGRKTVKKLAYIRNDMV
ncbi:hypothetical protein H2203_001706 [Taxawa tesnikishii (nom. ined.)]|nr:hypothetical protein H2203_001706 [Dothideales sp. JES 119]